MARVVQRRTSPPYLLILFVFLFLLSSALAVLFYINADKFSKELVDQKQQYGKVIQPSDASDPVIRDMIDSAGKKSAPSVVQQLREQVNKLAQGVAGNPNYTTAKAAMDNTNKKYGYESLVTIADAANVRVAQLQQRVDELGAERTKLVAEKDDVTKARDELMKKQVDDLAALSKQLKDIEEKAGAGHEDYQKQLAKTTKEISDKIADYEKRLSDMLAQSNKLKADIAKKDKRIADLENQLAAVNPTIDPSKPVLHADGKIIRLLEESKLAYINLGARDKLTVGMTLAVYPYTGIPEDHTKIKGKLRVVNVYQDSAECTITQESNRDPLAQDDLVANLAYDTTRTYNFVVDGMFDIRGTGTPSPTGLDDVKEMIKQAGAKVTDEVTVQTDFVVLGERPVNPTKPEAGAPPQVEKVYQEQLKAIAHYQQIENEAKALKRPIINSKQFLDLIGYVAPRTNK